MELINIEVVVIGLQKENIACAKTRAKMMIFSVDERYIMTEE